MIPPYNSLVMVGSSPELSLLPVLYSTFCLVTMLGNTFPNTTGVHFITDFSLGFTLLSFIVSNFTLRRNSSLITDYESNERFDYNLLETE